MKKSKRENNPPADFRNHPFKTLKGLAPKTTAEKRKTIVAPPRANTAPDQDEASLFLRAMDGVRPMDRAPSATPAGKQEGPRAPDTGPSEEGQLFLQAMLKIGATFRETAPDAEPEEAPRKSQSSRIRQVKRGTLRIDDELDLHGCQRDEALLQLERFIAGAFHRGRKAVLVITGKGNNSAEGPVLQRAVDEWLLGKGRAMIVEHAPAPRDRGGSGAVVVFLRKK